MGKSQNLVARLAVRNALWVTLGNYANQIIGFLSTLVFTRLLDPDVFGAIALGNFWYGIFGTRSKLGLNYATIRQNEITGSLLGTYFVLDCIAAGGSLLLTIVAAILFARWGWYSYSVIIVMLVLTIAESATIVTGWIGIVLEKELQLSRLTLVSLIANLIAYPIAITLAFTGMGIWSILSITVINLLFGGIGSYFVCRQRMPEILKTQWQFDWDLAKILLRQGISTGLSLTFLGILVTQIDNFLIGTFINSETLGYYDRAFRIASWPNLLLSLMINRIGYITMAKVKDDKKQLTHTLRMTYWMLLSLGLPISLWLSFGASDIVNLLYGIKYSESISYLRFLSISNYLGTLVSVALWLSIALGHSRKTLFLTGLHALLMVLFATPLTMLYGAIGTVAGVTVAMILALLFGCSYTLKQVQLSAQETFLPSFVAWAICAVGLYYFGSLPTIVQLYPLVRLVINGMMIVILFGGTLFLLQRNEMLERIQYVYWLWQGTDK